MNILMNLNVATVVELYRKKATLFFHFNCSVLDWKSNGMKIPFNPVVNHCKNGVFPPLQCMLAKTHVNNWWLTWNRNRVNGKIHRKHLSMCERYDNKTPTTFKWIVAQNLHSTRYGIQKNRCVIHRNRNNCSAISFTCTQTIAITFVLFCTFNVSGITRESF